MNNMISQDRVLVIIPAYNEQRNIFAVINGVKKALPSAGLLVVDDGSQDNTRQIVIKSGVAVVSHVFNLGYGAALETGYLYAVRCGYRYVVQIDGDGQHPPEELPRFLESLMNNEADIVIGNRKGSDYSSPFFRKIGQRLFSYLIYLLSGFRSGDSTSGFQGLNYKAFSLFAKGGFPHDYPDADVILMSQFAGLRIKEIPVRMLIRKQGVSMHSGFKPLYYVIKMFLSMFIVCLNKRSLRKLTDEPVASDEACRL